MSVSRKAQGGEETGWWRQQHQTTSIIVISPKLKWKRIATQHLPLKILNNAMNTRPSAKLDNLDDT